MRIIGKKLLTREHRKSENSDFNETLHTFREEGRSK